MSKSKWLMLPIQPITKEQSFLLNVLRFIAGQLVVFGHLLSFMNIHIPYLPLGSVIYIQSYAVVLFFLLSGYLIVSTSLYKYYKNPDYSYTIFFIERTCRIFPAYLCALILVAIIDGFTMRLPNNLYAQMYGANYNIHTFLLNVFMLQDYPITKVLFHLHKLKAPFEPFGSARPFWTVAIEWWLYLGFGYFIFSICKLRKVNGSTVMKIAVVGCKPLRAVGSWIWMLLLAIVPIFNLYGGGRSFLTIDWILGGLCFLLISIKLPDKFSQKIVVVPLFISLMILLIFAYIIEQSMYGILIAIISSLIFYLLMRWARNSSFNVSLKKTIIMKHLAGYTFCLYLMHYSIIQFFIWWHILNAFWLFVVCIITSNLVSYTLYYYVDRHYVQLRQLILMLYENFVMKKLNRSNSR